MTKQQKIITASVSAGLVAATLAIVLRGYIRGTAVMTAINPFYSHSVNTAMADASAEVTTAFKDQGLRFDQPIEPTTSCTTYGFQGFGVDVGCYRSAAFGVSDISPEFLSAWKQHASSSEQYLTTHGWQKVWNSEQPINQILDSTNSDTSVGVVYSKQFGKAKCEISMYYNGDSNPEYDGLNASLLCERGLHLFGYHY